MRIRLLATALFLLITAFNAFTANSDLVTETKELIIRAFDYKDSNPIHRPKTDSIKKKFQEILLTRDKHNLLHDYNSELQLLFNKIFENAYCIYEDSPDHRRIRIRRAYCFASIALLSDYYRSCTFLEYAKLSLTENLNKPDFDLLENQYLGILLIDAMLKIEVNQLGQNDITSLENYLDLNQQAVSKEIYNDSKALLEKYKRIARELG